MIILLTVYLVLLRKLYRLLLHTVINIIYQDGRTVAEKHDISRQAFLDWVHEGKPRCGPSYQHMYTSRASFKQALRYCKRHKEQLQADALAYSYENMSSTHFWKNVSKTANYKATFHVNKIGNAVGR